MRNKMSGGAAVGLVLVGLLALVADPALAQDTADAALESPWTFGLVASMLALSLGGFSAVLGMWVTRDSQRPIVFAFAMTMLIGTAVFVGVSQSYMDAVDGVQKRADLARMMTMIKEIAAQTGDMELAALIESEGGGIVEMPEPEPEPEPEPTAGDAVEDEVDDAGAGSPDADGEVVQ
jgi:hypothetical protein